MDGLDNWKGDSALIEPPPAASAMTVEFNPSMVAPASAYNPGDACADTVICGVDGNNRNGDQERNRK